MQAEEFEDNNLNPYGEDSNLDSSKVCLDGWIRISIQAIRILGEEKSETEGHKFKSLMKNKWKDWSWIRITCTTIQISEFEVMKNKSKRFESSSYGFESLIQNKAEGWRLDWRIRIFELWIQIPPWCKIQILQRRFESPI